MIRVLLADDHPVVREGIRRILDGASDVEIVGEAEDGLSTLSLARSLHPDVVLLDITMPGPGFLEVLRRIQGIAPEIRVLLLSVHPEDLFGLRALKAGAAGYVQKDRSPAVLAEAIRRVAETGRYVSADLAERLADVLLRPTPAAPHDLLSNREFQVFRMIGEGRSVKEIGETLALSSKTVSTHRSRILTKMRMKTNADLIRYAIHAGLVE